MRHLRLILLPLALAALVAACSASSTSSPGGEASTAAEQSAGTPPSDAGGGGGGGGGANGSVQYEISGDYSESGELRFVPEASYFETNGVTYLSFTNDGESAILFITFGDGGEAANFGNGEVSVSSTDCTFNLTRDDATGASGTFDCPNSFVILSSTETATASIEGSFEARK